MYAASCLDLDLFAVHYSLVKKVRRRKVLNRCYNLKLLLSIVTDYPYIICFSSPNRDESNINLWFFKEAVVKQISLQIKLLPFDL